MESPEVCGECLDLPRLFPGGSDSLFTVLHDFNVRTPRQQRGARQGFKRKTP